MSTSTSSVLESEYVEPIRPYSLNELAYMRERLYKSLRIGSVRAEHNKCNHFYLVKENGRKEKEIKENGTNDTGYCSVCWKIGKTPRYLKSKGQELISLYSNTFYKEPEFLTYDKVDLETVFYRWLYEKI